MNRSTAIKGTSEANGASKNLNVEGYNYATMQVTGTWSGSLAFEGTVNGDDWFAISGSPIPSGTATSSSIINGQWSFTVYGLFDMRARASLLNSGSVLVS